VSVALRALSPPCTVSVASPAPAPVLGRFVSWCIRVPPCAVSELVPLVAVPALVSGVGRAVSTVVPVPPCLVPDSVPASGVPVPSFRLSPPHPATRTAAREPKSHGVHFIRFTSGVRRDRSPSRPTMANLAGSTHAWGDGGHAGTARSRRLRIGLASPFFPVFQSGPTLIILGTRREPAPEIEVPVVQDSVPMLR
jgi:hypothetical protein